MTDLDLQTILNSGNITNIFIDGITIDEKVLTNSEIDAKNALLKIDDLADTPSNKTGKKGESLIVNDAEDALIYQPIAYSSYTVEPALLLTSTFQKISGYSPLITPINMSETLGTITALTAGIYHWSLERIYINEDTNPSTPVELFIELRKNTIPILSRSAIIGAATAGDEPAIDTYSTPLILDIEENDEFEIYVRATEGAGSPASTQLVRVQFTAHKIH